METSYEWCRGYVTADFPEETDPRSTLNKEPNGHSARCNRRWGWGAPALVASSAIRCQTPNNHLHWHAFDSLGMRVA